MGSAAVTTRCQRQRAAAPATSNAPAPGALAAPSRRGGWGRGGWGARAGARSIPLPAGLPLPPLLPRDRDPLGLLCDFCPRLSTRGKLSLFRQLYLDYVEKSHHNSGLVKDRMTRLASDAASLQDSLPVSLSSTVFLRVDDGRPDLMRAMIILLCRRTGFAGRRLHLRAA